VDLIAKRFEARYLEVEGKSREALALYGEIIAHFEHESPDEDVLPVYLKAAYLTMKEGDRDGGVTLLVRAAERFADHGLVQPVTELCQHLPRLDPSLTRLHLLFAHRMLERNHVRAACDLLKDLADRRGKPTLRQTLNRMASWPEPIVRGQLLEFLARAEARRRSVETEAVTSVPPAAASPAETPASPAVTPREVPAATVEIPAPPLPPRPKTVSRPAARVTLAGSEDAVPDQAAGLSPQAERPAVSELPPAAAPPEPSAPDVDVPSPAPARLTGPRRLTRPMPAEEAEPEPMVATASRPSEPAPVAEPVRPTATGPEPADVAPLPPREVEFISPEVTAPRPAARDTAGTRERTSHVAARPPGPPRVRRPSGPRPTPPVRRRKRRSAWGVILGVAAVAIIGVPAGLFLPRVVRVQGEARPPVIEDALAHTTPPAALAPPVDSSELAGSAAVDPPPLEAVSPGEEAPDDVRTSSAAAALPVSTNADRTPGREPVAERPASRSPEPPVTAPAVVVVPPVSRQPPAATPVPAPDRTRDTAAAPRTETPATSGPEPQVSADPRPLPAALQVDYEIVMVEGLDVLEIGVEGDGAGRRVVVLQQLSPADTLELRAADLGEAAIGVGGGRVLVTRHPSGGALGTARLGRFLVTARAPTVTPAELEPVLQRLVTLPPQ